ncbi:MAG: polyribonucleotide nucleotidyltransferase [Meiothermus sp.]|uniref:polyribonucleotide nucleotidyltransferase n=1 Tax=Meiothermus sp. TaxID=1955249 RepID=UPI0025FA53CA|nr:polyribonucleotide nucleotidyltransferase [Meiothermus sp.]MCS7059478.1 polyribonucleotide nucleotidyltransferase [Meiothermus sp.]MCS7194005.1 polyribonucleotide nucleotidyltransferase [Meiothermus sp.]MDW8090213.1 polyribonucleotide nucleotidyltransferase [Meiothermus sp.]MDW8481181.1 polyribonucleotide nucleotidyltransferase [Meiothermus sp.]
MSQANPVPQGKRYSVELGGRTLSIETGKYAKQVSGSVWVRYGDTVVMATAQASENPIEADFLPLTVEFEERHYAVGRIPGSFMRREGRPGEKAILSARLTDRPIRPLFPKGFRHEVQVIITVLSADQENTPDILGPIAASAALMLSDIPWEGPIAAVRVGLQGDRLVLNPTAQEESQLDLVVAGSKDAIIMVEAAAQEVPEDKLVEALEFAHQAMQPILELQEQMRSELGKEKFTFTPPAKLEPEVQAALYQRATEKGLSSVLQTASKGERSRALEAFAQALVEEFAPPAEDGTVDSLRRKQVAEAFDEVVRKELRRLILEENRRADGRTPTEIRPIWIETDVLPKAHGSALFTRGETQVLGVVTLGTGRDAQLVDDLGIETEDPFLVHYNFPPYSTGEVRRLRGVSRREVGHGNLAKRGLRAVLPSQEEFPYTIRVVGDVLESNGSSSMATVCAGCLALLDAGVPLKKHVAGVAMGLVKEGEQAVVLTDILGLEDALGDMDFKVTGTRDGITALQMDIKIKGLSPALMRQALYQAREARLHILRLMEQALPTHRAEMKPHVPRILALKVSPEKIGLIIGPGGKNIRQLEELGVEIDIEQDGTIRIYSANAAAAEEAKKRILSLTAEAKVGEIYEGTVTRITNFGAFVEILPGKDGLLHISQLAKGRVERVEDVLKLGQKVRVKVNSIDEQGRVDLIRPELEGIVPRRPAKR